MAAEGSNRDDRRLVRLHLLDWGRALDRCAQLQGEIDELVMLSEGLEDPFRAQKFSGMPPGKAQQDTTSHIAVRALELKGCYSQEIERLRGEIAEIMAEKLAVDSYIAGLPDLRQSIVEMRYRKRRTWDYIALKLNYSAASVKRIDAEVVDMMIRHNTFSVIGYERGLMSIM